MCQHQAANAVREAETWSDTYPTRHQAVNCVAGGWVSSVQAARAVPVLRGGNSLSLVEPASDSQSIPCLTSAAHASVRLKFALTRLLKVQARVKFGRALSLQIGAGLRSRQRQRVQRQQEGQTLLLLIRLHARGELTRALLRSVSRRSKTDGL